MFRRYECASSGALYFSDIWCSTVTAGLRTTASRCTLIPSSTIVPRPSIQIKLGCSKFKVCHCSIKRADFSRSYEYLFWRTTHFSCLRSHRVVYSSRFITSTPITLLVLMHCLIIKSISQIDPFIYVYVARVWLSLLLYQKGLYRCLLDRLILRLVNFKTLHRYKKMHGLGRSTFEFIALLAPMSSFCSFNNFILLIFSVSILVFLLQHQHLIIRVSSNENLG